MATQTPTDPFVTKALARIAALQVVRRELLQQIAEAQVELRQLDEEEMDLEMTMEKYAAFMGIAVPARDDADRKPRRPHLDLPRGAYSQLGYQALVELGGEASLGEIVSHLRASGRIPDAEHSYYSTRSALNRHERIEKTEKGFRVKGLDVAEWIEDLNSLPRSAVGGDA